MGPANSGSTLLPVSVAALALLIEVNVGANQMLIGSLANVLWRQSGGRTLSSIREFHLLGARHDTAARGCLHGGAVGVDVPHLVTVRQAAKVDAC